MASTGDELVGHFTTVLIDKKPYRAPSERPTARQIRQIALIGDDRDLWLQVLGSRDHLLTDDDVIAVREGQRFYSAPRDAAAHQDDTRATS